MDAEGRLEGRPPVLYEVLTHCEVEAQGAPARDLLVESAAVRMSTACEHCSAADGSLWCSGQM